MTLPEQLARYLARRLKLPFEKSVFYGTLPDRPAKAICVCATEMKPGDLRAQIAVRSDTDGAWPLSIGSEILRVLTEPHDVLAVPGGAYVHRVEVERGFEYRGTDAGAQLYAATVRVFASEEAGA